MLSHQLDYFGLASGLEGKDADHAVSLDDPNYDDFAGGAPAPFALAGSAKSGLVALDVTPKRLAQAFSVSAACPDQTIEPLYGIGALAAYDNSGAAKEAETETATLGYNEN